MLHYLLGVVLHVTLYLLCVFQSSIPDTAYSLHLTPSRILSCHPYSIPRPLMCWLFFSTLSVY